MLSRHTFVTVDYATHSNSTGIRELVHDVYMVLEKASPEKDETMHEFIDLRNSVFDVAHMSRRSIYDKLKQNTELDGKNN